MRMSDLPEASYSPDRLAQTAAWLGRTEAEVRAMETEDVLAALDEFIGERTRLIAETAGVPVPEARRIVDGLRSLNRPTTVWPSRTWDGSPETEVDRRFFDLRESGYTGPFDWDTGQPCTDPDTLAILAVLDRATERQMSQQTQAEDPGDAPDAARWTPDLDDVDEF